MPAVRSTALRAGRAVRAGWRRSPSPGADPAAPRGPGRAGRHPSCPPAPPTGPAHPAGESAAGAWSRHPSRPAAPPGRAARPPPRPMRHRGRWPAREPPPRLAVRPIPGRPAPRRCAGGWSARDSDRRRSTSTPVILAVVTTAQDAAPAGLRPPDPVPSAGPPTSPGFGPSASAAGACSSQALNRFAALLVPSRAHASTASAAASRRIGIRTCSSAENRLSTWSIAPRPGSPIPIRSREYFSVPSSSMIERSPL